MIVITVILASVVLGLLYLLFRPMDYWLKNNVPHEKPLPIFGNMTGFILKRRHITDEFSRLYNKFKDNRYFGFYQSFTPALMIKDPELIKQIAIKDFDHFVDHTPLPLLENERLLKKSLIALDGKEWKDMRGTLSPAFTSAKMRNMLPLIQECNENFIRYLKKNCKNGQIDQHLGKIFIDFMIDVIANVGFAVRSSALEEPQNEFAQAARKFRDLDWIANLKISIATVAPALFKILGLRVFSDDYVHSILQDTLKLRRSQNLTRQDFVQLLIEAQKGRLRHETTDNESNTGFATALESDIDKMEENRKKILDDEDLTAQALLFFIAGFSTSSVAISFTVFELAMNPEVQRKLRQEIDEVLRQDSGKVVYDSLLRMKYLDQVVSESLRKWPPVIQNDRICTKDFIIEPVTPTEPTLKVSKGTQLFFPNYQLHHDPRYFPNPEKFDPERFNEENKHKILPNTYLPFGIGPRNCIGSRFALINIKCLVFNLVANFDIVPNDRTNFNFRPSPWKFEFSTEDNWVTFKARS